MAGQGRGLLFYRRLPRAHDCFRSGEAPRVLAWGGARFPGVRSRPGEGGALSPERCAGAYRAGLAVELPDADADAGEFACLQGPPGEGENAFARALRVS